MVCTKNQSVTLSEAKDLPRHILHEILRFAQNDKTFFMQPGFLGPMGERYGAEKWTHHRL